MITKDKFEFQYGRVEMRAKLPTGAGTWPAFWMLGADIDTNPWPGAGEMDIMEHVGNSQDVIFNSLHFPGNSGGDAITVDTPLPGASDDFNIYALEWTEDQITFYVNDTVGLSFPNSESVPFQKDFFLLVNVAMGGTFGGAIDPAFTESTFEIDYIRVYQ
jgi:beta-glucanase (GH16 family)